MALVVSAQSGLYRVGSTWVGGVAPTASDQWKVSAGHVVTVDEDASWAAETGPQGEIESGGRVVIAAGAVVTLACGDLTNDGVLEVNGEYRAEAVNWTMLSVGKVVLGPFGRIVHAHPASAPTTLIESSPSRLLLLVSSTGAVYMPEAAGVPAAEPPTSLQRFSVPLVEQGIVITVRVTMSGTLLTSEGFQAADRELHWRTNAHDPPTQQYSTMHFATTWHFARRVSIAHGTSEIEL